MARLISSGFELQSNTNSIELDTFVGTTSISTTTVRSGLASLRCNPTAGTGTVKFKFDTVTHAGRIFFRAYVRFASFPSSITNSLHAGEIEIMGLGIATDYSAYVTIKTDGTLRLYDFNDALVGSASSALSLNTWYRLEMGHEITSAFLELKLDGAVVATENTNPGQAISFAALGPSAEQALTGGTAHTCTMDMFLDDIAVNDNTTSFQNTYPGAGQIEHLLPNAAGDNNAWTVQVGGTAGSTNNFTRIDEIIPDDATSYNGDITSGDTDDYNLANTSSNIGSSDTINVVAVGARYRDAINVSPAKFKVRIKKAAAGTVAKSVEFTPVTTSWVTNFNTTPFNHMLVTYQDPDSSNWTKATLDTSQVGMEISTTGTNAVDISTLYVMVDSTPVAVVAAKSAPSLALMGVGA